MATHLRVLRKSYPMNINMTGLNVFCFCSLGRSRLSIRRVKAGKNNCSNASPASMVWSLFAIICAYQYKCEGEISIQRLAMDVKNKLSGEVAESRTSINISGKHMNIRFTLPCSSAFIFISHYKFIS